ncbi:MAG TPA: magnesium/cobalt transporter CorA [Polyangiaceae bacterium]|nr:magnesium/cobalt transporter CorA [Polyangiaceae bacterium]
MSAMIRILDLVPGQRPVVSDSADKIAPPQPGHTRWIDIKEQREADMQLLGERFPFHHLTLEDCLHFDQRPKVEEFDDYLFVVLHAFSCPSETCDAEAEEVHLFLGSQNYLITVHTADIAAIDTVWKRAESDAGLATRGADFLLYLVSDAIVDANFPILDRVNDALESIEDSVLERQNPDDLARIFQLKRTLVLMRKVLSPERDVFAVLSKRGDPRISEKTALYFRDVYDHLVRIYESIDAGRDLLGNALDAYLSMTSNRTNEIMKRLTLLSAVFLPLTFITGFFGQNFEHLPFHSDALMYAMAACCIAIPTVMVVVFKRSGWF